MRANPRAVLLTSQQVIDSLRGVCPPTIRCARASVHARQRPALEAAKK